MSPPVKVDDAHEDLKPALALAAGILVAAALMLLGVLIGRATAATPASPTNHGQAARTDDYFDGLRVGEAQGRQEGRALQEGSSLPAGARRPVQEAFNAGYAAGTNDAFAGYDGGWRFGVPYLVTLEEGTGQIVYHISSRTPVLKHVNYYLCANGHDLCHQRRH